MCCSQSLVDAFDDEYRRQSLACIAGDDCRFYCGRVWGTAQRSGNIWSCGRFYETARAKRSDKLVLNGEEEATWAEFRNDTKGSEGRLVLFARYVTRNKGSKNDSRCVEVVVVTNLRRLLTSRPMSDG